MSQGTTPSTEVRTAAEAFVARLMDDVQLYDQLDGADVLSAAVAAGRGMGFEFTEAELEAAIAAELGIEVLDLAPSLYAPPCNSKSGCRTPCMYCN